MHKQPTHYSSYTLHDDNNNNWTRQHSCLLNFLEDMQVNNTTKIVYLSSFRQYSVTVLLPGCFSFSSAVCLSPFLSPSPAPLCVCVCVCVCVCRSVGMAATAAEWHRSAGSIPALSPWSLHNFGARLLCPIWWVHSAALQYLYISSTCQPCLPANQVFSSTPPSGD